MPELRITPSMKTKTVDPERMKQELSDFCANHPGANKEIRDRIFEYSHDRTVCEKIGARYTRMNDSDILKVAYYSLLIIKDENWKPEH